MNLTYFPSRYGGIFLIYLTIYSKVSLDIRAYTAANTPQGKVQ